MILGIVFLLFLTRSSGEEFTASCSNETSGLFTFRPMEDGVKGRYFHQWCTDKLEDFIQTWNLLVTVDNRNESQCKPNLFGSYESEKHSIVVKELNQKFDCSKVCFSIKLDLIYSSCYSVQDWLTVDEKAVRSQLVTQYVDNPYTADYFENSTTFATVEDERDGVYVHWYFSRIPRSEYALELRDRNDKLVPLNVSCTEWGQEIRCLVALYGAGADGTGTAGTGGQWELSLWHRAAWCHGDVFKPATCQYIVNFSYPTSADPPAVGRGSPAVYWACAGAAAAVGAVCAVCAGGAALVARCRETPARFWKRACARCRTRYEAPGLAEAAGAGAGDAVEAVEAGQEEAGRGILLLYARDAAPYMRAVHALRDMLRLVAPGEPVYDLFSAETLSECASSPGAWLTAALARCRLVVVQTPALRDLYHVAAAAHPATHRLTLSAPLLGSVVQYRRAQYGDVALGAALAALRAACLAARPSHLPYRRYYLCSISELEVDMLAHVVPFRRYVLPHAAPLLLADLAPPAAPGDPPGAPSAAPSAALLPLMEEFKSSLQEFLDYVRGYPDYLQDLLTVI